MTFAVDWALNNNDLSISMPVVADDTLVSLLPLAEEYQVEHIRRKCERYIGTQLTSGGAALSTDQQVLYLWMCEVYGFPEHRDRLVQLAASNSLQDLKGSRFYDSLPLLASRDVMLRRCEQLEGTSQKLTAEVTQLNVQNRELQNDYTRETNAYSEMKTKVKNVQTSTKKFFSVFLDIQKSCTGPGGASFSVDAECNNPYNTQRFCQRCVYKKVRSAIQTPLDAINTCLAASTR